MRKTISFSSASQNPVHMAGPESNSLDQLKDLGDDIAKMFEYLRARAYPEMVAVERATKRRKEAATNKETRVGVSTRAKLDSNYREIIGIVGVTKNPSFARERLNSVFKKNIVPIMGTYLEVYKREITPTLLNNVMGRVHSLRNIYKIGQDRPNSAMATLLPSDRIFVNELFSGEQSDFRMNGGLFAINIYCDKYKCGEVDPDSGILLAPIQPVHFLNSVFRTSLLTSLVYVEILEMIIVNRLKKEMTDDEIYVMGDGSEGEWAKVITSIALCARPPPSDIEPKYIDSLKEFGAACQFMMRTPVFEKIIGTAHHIVLFRVLMKITTGDDAETCALILLEDVKIHLKSALPTEEDPYTAIVALYQYAIQCIAHLLAEEYPQLKDKDGVILNHSLVEHITEYDIESKRIRDIKVPESNIPTYRSWMRVIYGKNIPEPQRDEYDYELDMANMKQALENRSFIVHEEIQTLTSDEIDALEDLKEELNAVGDSINIVNARSDRLNMLLRAVRLLGEVDMEEAPYIAPLATFIVQERSKVLTFAKDAFGAAQSVFNKLPLFGGKQPPPPGGKQAAKQPYISKEQAMVNHYGSKFAAKNVRPKSPDANSAGSASDDEEKLVEEIDNFNPLDDEFDPYKRERAEVE